MVTEDLEYDAISAIIMIMMTMTMMIITTHTNIHINELKYWYTCRNMVKQQPR